MKKILVIAGLLLVPYYSKFVPFLWHVDDASVFSQAHKTASHLGAVTAGMTPVLIGVIVYLWKKHFRE